MSDLRYPVGRFQAPDPIIAEHRDQWIQELAASAGLLRQAVAGLSDQQLDTPYREGGWTVRQVVHHLADSHINSYCRVRLALTEESPTIKAYKEGLWADLADARTGPVDPSLAILEAVHDRWIRLMRTLTDSDFARAFVHPEHGTRIRLDRTLGTYAWHARHHTAHITGLRQRMGW